MNYPLNHSKKTVIRQCLQLLPSEHLACPLLNYDNKKLTTEGLIKFFVAAQLGGWQSYSEFDIRMDANEDLMNEIGVQNISGSQLSRRIRNLDNEVTLNLFLKSVELLHRYLPKNKKVSETVGPLAVLDSTTINLSALSEWAEVSADYYAVKMHTRLRVLSEEIQYPDKAIPSTGKVSDHEGGDLLIEDSVDVTYLLDRGYMDLYRINEWIKRQIKFVVRLRKGITERTLEEYEVPEGTNILRDARVILGADGKMQPVRVVEYHDDEGNFYKVATTRWDLTSVQIAELYKSRWLIELFFKWIKQSLRFIKIWSTDPQGIWNQMFIGMIAYILTLIVKLITNSKKTLKEILMYIRSFFDKNWNHFMDKLNKIPKKTSKGRQKVPDKPKKNVNFGSVALVHKENAKRIKKKIK